MKSESVKQTIWLRTPISYYGGKQQMLKHILPRIPEHKTYVEPFFGGGAVFWAKKQADIEIINDNNAHVINFYKQLKHHFDELKHLIDATLHSRDSYKEALVIYHAPYLFSELKRAWAFWITTNMGYSKMIGSWGYDNAGKAERSIMNRKIELTTEYATRLERVQIECNDAIKVIQSRDMPDAFLYCDPPYVGADQGHYGGYTQEHFDHLLYGLSQAKGKFLLSSYPNSTLQEYVEACNWHQMDVNMHLSASSKAGSKKTEILTANYPI